MDTFKGNIGDLQFYFKPRNNGDFYLIEPYRQIDMRPFKLTKRAAGDEATRSPWVIGEGENVPDNIRSMEKSFSDFLQSKIDPA
jgi:hypothetical protein